MVLTIKRAILHILDGNSGVTVFSEEELDLTESSIAVFLNKHIEKLWGDSALRRGVFSQDNELEKKLKSYLAEELSFRELSLFIAQRLYKGISESDKIDSSDILVCDCVMDETPVMVVLKCDNKIGYTHQVVQGEGKVRNDLINHYAILPSPGQKIGECAFIRLTDFSLRHMGKKRSIQGEPADLMGDILLESTFEISPKESIKAVEQIAQAVAEEHGKDSVEAQVKIKQFVTDHFEEEPYLEPEKIAEAVFEQAEELRTEFVELTRQAKVPQKVEVDDYVAKKVNSNVKLSTDIGIELSFPAAYYQNEKYIQIHNNPDGTLSIQINQIGKITNK